MAQDVMRCPHTGRVLAVVIDKRYVRMRCRERRCPQVIEAKARGEIAFHVWDTQNPGMMVTEFEPQRRTQRNIAA